MVVDNLDFPSLAVAPGEANPPLLVDANTVYVPGCGEDEYAARTPRVLWTEGCEHEPRCVTTLPSEIWISGKTSMATMPLLYSPYM